MADEPIQGQAEAEAVLAHLREDPRSHTVDAIVDATGLEPDQVQAALDEWSPGSGGGVAYHGPGRGGPWISTEGDEYCLVETSDD